MAIGEVAGELVGYCTCGNRRSRQVHEVITCLPLLLADVVYT